MGVYKASSDLVKDDLTGMVVFLGTNEKNKTIGLTNPSGGLAATAIRLDASWDNGSTWITSISLSDPNAALGAAYVASLAPGESANTQDRVFGATHVRVVRTDSAGAGTIKPVLTVHRN